MPENFENPVRAGWLSEEDAKRRIDAFEERFGPRHRLLAAHAALPLMLDPELLNLIRINFRETRDMEWIAEADILLSPLCRAIDDELFEFEPRVREVLLQILREENGLGRLTEIADFLAEYLTSRPGKFQRADASRAYGWIAMAYRNPADALKKMEMFVNQSLSGGGGQQIGRAEKLWLVFMTEVLVDPLSQSPDGKAFEQLLEKSRRMGAQLYGLAPAERLRAEVERLTPVDLVHKKNLAILGLAASKVMHELRIFLNKFNLVNRSLKSEPLSEYARELVGLIEEESAQLGDSVDKLLYGLAPEEGSRMDVEGLVADDLVYNKSFAILGEAVPKFNHEVGNFFNKVRMVYRTLKAENLSESARELVDLIGEESARELVDLIGEESAHLGDFVNKFMNVARKRELFTIKVDFDIVVSDVIAFYGPLGAEKNIVIEKEGFEGLPEVCIDLQQMRGVMDTLVKNALEAVGEDGRVVVRGTFVDGGLEIGVIDDGPGIDEKTAKKIFDPFFTTKGGKRTGLGLALAKSVVKAHGGEIRCESEAGKGTTFIIRIPVGG